MTCQELDQLLDGWIDRELPPDLRLIVVEHLDICPDCRKYIEQYRKTIDLTRLAFLPTDEKPLPEDLVKSIVRLASHS